MAKFTKLHTSDGTLVLVPSDFYNKTLRIIRGNPAGFSKTRMYIYFVDSDGIMWRHPSSMELFDATVSGSLERVISQCEFRPEVYFV